MPRPHNCAAYSTSHCHFPHCACALSAADAIRRGEATGVFSFDKDDDSADYDQIGTRRRYEWSE